MKIFVALILIFASMHVCIALPLPLSLGQYWPTGYVNTTALLGTASSLLTNVIGQLPSRETVRSFIPEMPQLCTVDTPPPANIIKIGQLFISPNVTFYKVNEKKELKKIPPKVLQNEIHQHLKLRGLREDDDDAGLRMCYGLTQEEEDKLVEAGVEHCELTVFPKLTHSSKSPKNKN